MKEDERAGDTSGVFLNVLVEGYGPGRGRRTLQMNNRSLLREEEECFGKVLCRLDLEGFKLKPEGGEKDAIMSSIGNRIGRHM